MEALGFGHPGSGHAILDDLAHDVELALERRLVLHLAPVAADEDLADLRHDRARLRTAFRRVDGHVAPADELQTRLADRALEDLAALVSLIRLARQEHHADAVFAGLGKASFCMRELLLEERVRDLQQDAGAVARQRVAAAGATMLEVGEDRQALLDDVARLGSAHVDHEADPAGVVLEARVVESLPSKRRHQATLGRAAPFRRAFLSIAGGSPPSSAAVTRPSRNCERSMFVDSTTIVSVFSTPSIERKPADQRLERRGVERSSP